MTKLLTFHSLMISPERSDMSLSDRLISGLAAHIAHLFYTSQELQKEKKVGRYSLAITVTTIVYAYIIVDVGIVYQLINILEPVQRELFSSVLVCEPTLVCVNSDVYHCC